MLDLCLNGRYSWITFKSDRCYFLTGKDSKANFGHDKVEFSKSSSPAYLFIVNGRDVGKHYVRKGSHSCVFYPFKNRKQLAGVPRLKPIGLPLFSVFIEHGYLKLEGGQYLSFIKCATMCICCQEPYLNQVQSETLMVTNLRVERTMNRETGKRRARRRLSELHRLALNNVDTV